MNKQTVPKTKFSIGQIMCLSCLWVIGLAAQMHGAAADVQPGAGRVTSLSLHSAILGRDVPLHVWLPPGYDAPASSEKKYPVMYLFDGAKMFDAVAGAKSSMHLDATLDRLTAQGEIEPVIVVTIDQSRTQEGRQTEYCPYRDPFTVHDVATHGDLLPEFLAKEVLPRISADFRTTHDFKETGIGGLSYSGAAALYVLIHCPWTFGLAILESPSLQIGNGQLLRDTVNLVSAGRRVAIGVGTRELGQDEATLTHDGSRKGDVNRAMVHWSEELAANLRSATAPPAVQLTVEDGAEHKEKSWAGRFPKDFVFLFGIRAEPK